MIIRCVGGIRPRPGRITALARRDRAIARTRKRADLRAPAMHGFRETVQQQHQRRARCAGDEGVEGQAGCNGDFFELGHSGGFRCEPV